MQQLLFKACGREQSFNEELNLVCDYFYDDFFQRRIVSTVTNLSKSKPVVED